MPRYIDTEKINYQYLPIPAIGDQFITKSAIDNMPEEDVAEVKHGKWKEGRFGNGITVPFRKYYICDQCNHTSKKKSRYCDNCGAKMRRR